MRRAYAVAVAYARTCGSNDSDDVDSFAKQCVKEAVNRLRHTSPSAAELIDATLKSAASSFGIEGPAAHEPVPDERHRSMLPQPLGNLPNAIRWQWWLALPLSLCGAVLSVAARAYRSVAARGE